LIYSYIKLLTVDLISESHLNFFGEMLD